jgi:hypothetical protein
MNNTLIIRSATAADARALAHLAALDSSVVPAAPQLVASNGEHIIAALSTSDGAAIADPFTPSAGAVELLRRRASQVTARPKTRRAFALRTVTN